MADITMPKMGFDMEEGTIVRWIKQVGDDVTKGEPIAEIETDKVTIEIEAFSSGKLTKIVAGEGETVAVGATIAVLDGDGDGAAPPAVSDQAAAAEQPSGEPAAVQGAGEGGEAASSTAAQTTAGRKGDETVATGTDMPTAESAPAREGAAPQQPAAEQPADDRGFVPASPVAKRLARENNISLSQITGSGPGGRIVRDDVEAFLKSGKPAQQPAAAQQPSGKPTVEQQQPTPAAETRQATQQPAQPQAQPAPAAAQQPGSRREPLSRLRQTIARRLVQSKAPVPHFYVTTEIDMAAAMDLRKQLNEGGGVKITVNDMIVKAAALAMTKFPVLNASFADDALEYHDYINAGIAIATDNGLLAPAVTDVDRKSLGTISREAKDLIERTRNGKATPDELGRGTFSTSNLGMYPVDSFVAIINPPQAAIVAVGAVSDQPVVRNGEITIGKIMKATISVDHRVADGAVAAEYMQELKRLLEMPMQILL